MKNHFSQLDNRLYLIRAVFCLVISLTSFQALALGETSYISHDAAEGDMLLAGNGQTATLYIDPDDYPGLHRAVGDLQEDIVRVTGQRAAIVNSADELADTAVIIGSLGNSALIDQLAANGVIDVTGTEGQWDGFMLELVDNPLPNVDQALIIVGADKRGAIFGTYDLSEQIGVSPWYWWADVPVKQADSLYITANTRKEQAPKVKYRGIFLNDEAPALTNWVRENYGNYNSAFYENVFELILRLKGNFLWPAMWNNAFNADDPQNMVLADEMGIVMSTSHHEPMMRAQKEWTWADDADKGNGEWDYNTNADVLREFWRGGVERNRSYESIITLAMRGDGDMPMSEETNIELLERIVDDQREIIADVYQQPLEDIPQVWTLYKEVQGYYERGMRVEDNITLLWSDDNWGQIRHLPTPEERERSGGHGVYYHFDYVGGPRSYRWINTTPVAKIWEQMNLAWHFEAREIWVVNVGDLKPMEVPIEFFLRMAWDPDAWPKERIPEFTELWAEREFGPDHATDIAALYHGYAQHNHNRKPELQNFGSYSLLNYREYERVTDKLESMVELAENINDELPAEMRDAYFQLILHPVKASANLTAMYEAVELNRLYASQGRMSANAYADLAEFLFELDAQLSDEFHTLNDGKWNHMMSQSRIGYRSWNNPPENIMPDVSRILPATNDGFGVAVEGTAEAWPQTESLALDFDLYGQEERFIDVFARTSTTPEYDISTSSDWIQVRPAENTMPTDGRLEVSIDWTALNTGEHTGTVIIESNGEQASIAVSAYKPAPALLAGASGFIEADGYISIEAASFSRSTIRNTYQWQEIPQHGRTVSGMTPVPLRPVSGAYDRAFSLDEKTPLLEYDVIFTEPGDIEITGLFTPTSPIRPNRGLRYAIAIDDEEPQIVDILAGENNRSWEEAVSNAIREGVSTHTIEEAGQHLVRVYMVDTAITLQKILVDTGGLQPSYLGPEESEYLQ